MRTVLFVAVALSSASVVAHRAEGAVLLGINSVSNGGGLYTYDTSTGMASLLGPTSGVLGSSVSSGNCLAWDNVNHVAYYTSLGVAGGDHLYRYNPGTNITDDLGTIDAAANGSFYNGKYYTISSEGKLTQISFDAGGMVSQKKQFELTGGRMWGFGDIAIRSDGVLFGSGSDFVHGTDFFSVDLSPLNSMPLPSSLSVNYVLPMTASLMQLAFEPGTDALYGYVTGLGDIYTLNQSTGAQTFVRTVNPSLGLSFNDLASVPVPGTAALVGLGGLVAMRRARRTR